MYSGTHTKAATIMTAATSHRFILIFSDTASASLGSFCGSAPCYGSAENVLVVPIVIPELELGNVEGEILLGDVMERAENAAIQERPEAVNSPSVDIAPHVFATDVRDAGTLVASLVQLLVKPAFVCGD
jgi:hypothetical protein